ncbi:MAG: hypothetical protein NZ898_05565 [Myxococcota bacterium]|nr:hypothetical protein [Myxococcota bacterium]MDW8362381.1 hypothetical protein [Myxococcales bacterium]
MSRFPTSSDPLRALLDAIGSARRHLGLKLVSVLVAVALFGAVRGAEDAQRSVYVDVVALLPDGGDKILLSELPDRVRVTLRGSRSLLNALRRELLEPVTVDLRDTSLRYYYFEPTSFELPASLSVVAIEPASIPLTWVDRDRRELPVVVRFEGSPGPGLRLAANPRVEPPRIVVSGPSLELVALPHVETDPLDVSELGPGTHERRVRLVRPPPHGRYEGPDVVRVSFEVVVDEQQRRIDDVPVTVLGPGARLTLRPDRVDVVVRGRPDVLEDFGPDRLLAVVQLPPDAPPTGSLVLPVQVRGIGEGLAVLRVEPPEVLVALGRGR